jgi:DNA end-binding protein Ku
VPRRKDPPPTVDEPTRSAASETSFIRGFWSGNLSFGLVSIPVSLITAQHSNRVSLRMLAPDGTQLRRRFFCPADNGALDNSDIVRGYEVEKDRFVVVTDEELEALVPKLSQEIDLTRFVPLADIDPMRFDHGYFLIPSKRASKAYRLLARIMEDRARAGIATFVMRGKQYLVAIAARGGLLRAYTLRFADELRTLQDVEIAADGAIDERAVSAFQNSIDALRSDALEPSDLEDVHTQTLLALIERKRGTGTDVIALQSDRDEEAVGAKIVDLMEYLRKSITGEPAQKAEDSKRPRSATRKRTAVASQPVKPRKTRSRGRNTETTT